MPIFYIKGLKCKSALFRHEIAYVLGQIQSPLSVNALRENLEDISESHMVSWLLCGRLTI